MSEPSVLLTFEQLKEQYNLVLSPDALRAAERRGEFPPRRRIGARRVAWLRKEVDAWVASLPTGDQKPNRRVRAAWEPKPERNVTRKLGRPTRAMIAEREAAARGER